MTSTTLAVSPCEAIPLARAQLNSLIGQLRPAVTGLLGPERGRPVLEQLELSRLQANQQLDQAHADCQAAIGQALQAAIVRQVLEGGTLPSIPGLPSFPAAVGS